MSRPSRKRGGRAGFTLLEVLLAIFVVAVAGGAIVQMSTKLTHDLSERGARIGALRAAEQRARELSADPLAFPDLGVTDGVLEPPFESYRWTLEIETFAISLPPPQRDLAVTSSIFENSIANTEAPQPSIRRASLRVYHELEDPDAGDVFIAFFVAPPELVDLGDEAAAQDEPGDEPGRAEGTP